MEGVKPHRLFDGSYLILRLRIGRELIAVAPVVVETARASSLFLRRVLHQTTARADEPNVHVTHGTNLPVEHLQWVGVVKGTAVSGRKVVVDQRLAAIVVTGPIVAGTAVARLNALARKVNCKSQGACSHVLMMAMCC